MNQQQRPDVCDDRIVHEARVEQARKGVPPDEALLEVAALFKVLGDYSRVRILQALSVQELCVCDLSEVLRMSSSAVSHQLRVLRAAKLVRYRREGKNAFYSLGDNRVQRLMEQALEHVQE